MSEIKLTRYLNQIEAKYMNARDKWESLQKELSAEEERYKNIKWRNLSAQGREEEQANHSKKKAEICKKIEELRKAFSDSVESVKADSDKVFNKVFRYNPSDVDQNGVAILQNGSLKDSELIELAESYRKKGNYTMYFMVSEKLNKDKPYRLLSEQERKSYAYYNQAQQRRINREDHELIDEFRDVCLKALREEDYLSNGIHNVHEEFYQRYKENAEDIVSEVSSPWE